MGGLDNWFVQVRPGSARLPYTTHQLVGMKQPAYPSCRYAARFIRFFRTPSTICGKFLADFVDTSDTLQLYGESPKNTILISV